MARDNSTPTRDFLTNAKTIIAMLFTTGAALVTITVYSVSSADTALDAESLAIENKNRITIVEHGTSAIPYIKEDIQEMKSDIQLLSNEVSDIKQSQFNQERVSAEQLRLLRRALEHLEE